MVTTANNIILSGLARKLIQDGFLDEPSALDAVENAQKNKQNSYQFKAFLMY